MPEAFDLVKRRHAVDKEHVRNNLVIEQKADKAVIQVTTGSGKQLTVSVQKKNLNHILEQAAQTLSDHYHHPMTEPLPRHCFRAVEAAVEFEALRAQGKTNFPTLTDLISAIESKEAEPPTDKMGEFSHYITNLGRDAEGFLDKLDRRKKERGV